MFVLITGTLHRDPELERTPGGAAMCEHRMAFFSIIIGARRDVQDQLEQDGLGPDIIAQIVANTIARALAYAAVNLNLSQPDLARFFCDIALVEAEQHMPGPGVARH